MKPSIKIALAGILLLSAPGAFAQETRTEQIQSAGTERTYRIYLPDNLPAANLHIIDKLDPNTTASMQKDLARGHESEIEGLLFQMLDLGEKMGVYMKTYRHVADTLINRLSTDSRKAREARSIVCSLEWI